MPDEPAPPRLTPSGPSPEEVAGRSFPSARRGLDPDAVRRYLAEVAAALRDARRREAELSDRLATVQATPPEPPQLDEASLTAALGAETARVLQSAHEAAREIVAKAERRASALVEDAESAVAERTRHAEHEAAELIERARAEASALLESTHEQARGVVAEAREARRRILTDLTERRKALSSQVEQLRAGRNALNEVLDGVAGSMLASVEAIRHRLDSADDQARAAAQAVEVNAPHEDLGTDTAELPELADLAAPATPAGGAAATAAARHEAPEPAGFVPVEPEPAGANEEEAEQGEIQAGATNGIDELFARIRESRQHERAEARAQRVAEDSAFDLFPGATREATVPVAPASPVPSEGPAVEPGPEPSPERPRRRRASASTEQAAAVPTPPASAIEIAVEDDDFQMLVRRDQLLAPAAAEIGRALKRTLRLEQNELLDSVRNLSRPDELHQLLPGEAMAERLAAAIGRGLHAAWASGDAFVANVLGVSGPSRLLDESEREGAIAEIGRLAALEIVDAIRRRMDAGLSRAAEEDGTAAVGSAFRDWKGSRIDELAGDYASRAFARATLQASRSRGAKVTWIVDDGDMACPDCDDNALAGVIPAGSDFPTGQAHPPVHPGCRCLVVPVQR